MEQTTRTPEEERLWQQALREVADDAAHNHRYRKIETSLQEGMDRVRKRYRRLKQQQG
jgi:hypothetical protein